MNKVPSLIEHAFPLKQASLDSVHAVNVRLGYISTLHIRPARRALTSWFGWQCMTAVIERAKAKACNMRQDYWLYAAYNCSTPNPHLARAQDTFGNLLAKVKGSFLVSQAQVAGAEVAI